MKDEAPQQNEARVVRSTFGGGWIVPTSDRARDILAKFFGEPATPLQALCGDLGYIVEPVDIESLATVLRAWGIRWEVIL